MQTAHGTQHKKAMQFVKSIYWICLIRAPAFSTSNLDFNVDTIQILI